MRQSLGGNGKTPRKAATQVPKRKGTNGGARRVTMDIVTGKELLSVYFDPSKALDCQNYDHDWLGEHMYAPGSVIKEDADGVVSVRLSNGDVFKMPGNSIVKVTEQDDSGVEDILRLRDFSEMSLIHTLRVRYARDDIYTFVGPILISINPYKWFRDLYNVQTMSDYHNHKQGEALPPHVFVVAESAYSSLMQSASAPRSKDQSIIISGESGAGKTEATKVIMSYLARITAMDHNNQGASASQKSAPANDNAGYLGELEQRVLNTNPILEAFGNAKTVRNDNSSRFGKFIKIQFGKHGRIVGATIEKYLLEKTRIVHQMEGERNFHIFYQLLSGAPAELKQKLQLTGKASDYSFLSTDFPSMEADDIEEFQLTIDCMKSIGIDDSMQEQIFQLLSGVLHLGDIDFDKDDAEDQVGGVCPDTADSFKLASQMLGLDSEEMLAAMTKQNMHVGGSVIVKTQSRAQAIDKRDSFAKSVYSMTFNWLVDKINATIASAEQPWGFIGVLDIYGFENFDHNGFEQLLINYANEKLQNHFNKHIFQIEQTEYESENIDWSYITFNDNQACVDLIDSKPNGKAGIFQTLDDSNASGRLDVNANFLAQLNQVFSGGSNSRHPNYLTPRFNSDQIFGIHHYAGEVYYNILGFAEKNRDSTNVDMKDLMAKSSNSLLRTMMEDTLKSDAVMAAASAIAGSNAHASLKKPGVAKKTSGSAPVAVAGSTGKVSTGSTSARSSFVNKLKEDSISKQFTNSLTMLYETLDSTSPHYVRCVKPNGRKQPDCLNVKDTLQQLKYAGMMETIRIRQEGYAFRQLHADFYKRFSILVPGCGTLAKLVDTLSKNLSVSSESWQVGTTKIFLKSAMSERLERLLWLRYASSGRIIQRSWRFKRANRSATCIQKYVRMFVARSKFVKMVKACILIQSTFRRYKEGWRFRIAFTSILTIQRVIRGKVGRIKARRLRNPYNRMNYQELTAALKVVESELEEAFKNQQFILCEELQAKAKDIEAARSKLPIPEVIPTSRAELNILLLEMKFAMEYFTEANDSVKLAALEEKNNKLLKYKEKFPTVEEKTKELEVAKDSLKSAMDKKEFRRCGELQEKVSALEAELLALTKAGSFAQKPSVDSMKSRKVDLETQIAAALSEKKFDVCSELQVELDTLVIDLEKRDITPEQASQKLEALNAESHGARIAKDFRRMAELCGEIEELTVLAANVKVVHHYETLTYEQLSDKINACKKEMESAIASKNYKRCDEIEKDLLDLNAAQAKLPAPEPKFTAAELRLKISEIEKAIEESLAAKNYRLCDDLNLEHEKLKAILDSLPTVASVSKKISELEIELKTLIAKKSYAKCEEVESQLTSLKAQLKELKDAEPKVEKKGPAVKVIARQPLGKKAGSTVPVSAVKAVASMPPSSPILKPSNGFASPHATPTKRDVLNNTAAKSVGKKTSTKLGKENAKDNIARSENERPVSKLRPKAPITVSDASTILEVAMAMAAVRSDAALLVSAVDGGLTGIMTDNDVTRRVVSQYIDPASTIVEQVMTKNPKCVHNDDSALDALEMMVDNRFRHLPVLDAEGAVCGLLDIAKCLYDAISILEKVQSEDSGASGSSAAADVMVSAMKQVAGSKGNNKAQLLAMQAMMEQIFGGSVPTLRTIIGDERYASVSPTTSIREASKLMAGIRKGVLVMDGPDLLGIFTPKDLLTRVVAKSLDVDEVQISEVMTSNPDCVGPDLTLLDALREMHDHKFLHLPVRDDDGTILGVVDVMELVCSTAGGNGSSNGKGWRDFFGGALNARGDRSYEASETSSHHSYQPHKDNSSLHKVKASSVSCKQTSTKDSSNKAGKVDNKATSSSSANLNNSVASAKSMPAIQERPVSKLRPKAPITLSDASTILEVAMAMAAVRSDAALLVSAVDGGLTGIITDNDVTRRVVSQYIDPASTIVEQVMTKNPKCVHNDDSALDALEMMVDNRFRHLPVLDAEGAVCGLLDIAKCLYDAISILEKVQSEDSGASGSSAAADVMVSAMKQVAGSKGNNKAQLLAMQAMMEQIFGGSVPTLRTIIGDERYASVSPTTSIREASKLMAGIRKGVLVMDGPDLLGIFTPKDLLTRVVAKSLDVDEVQISEVMTSNPDCVGPDLTLLDALREMHDHKFLHLPVRDDDGTILGVVDVMELVCSTAGGNGSSNGKGWRDFFGGALNARGDRSYEASETSSHHSYSHSVATAKSKTRSVASKKNSKRASLDGTASIASVDPERKYRPVSKLRPKAPIKLSESLSLLEVAEAMASRRVDAALLTNESGALAGIITDNDVTRRVVSQYIDPASTIVEQVMTKNPKCVHNDDSALDALEMMVDNRFRHLPVLDAEGAVCGLLDIAKCLYDAISILEKVQSEDSGASGSSAAADVMVSAMKQVAGSKGNNKAQLLAMQAMMEQIFGGSVPTLRSILSSHGDFRFVRPSANVREAATLMAESRKGVLVMDEDELVGILTPKDILCRIVAKSKSPDLTAVSSVMTPNPDCVGPDLTLLDALREMHDHKFLHLPVRDDDGTILGVVDVMELVCSTAGGNGSSNGKGWRDFFGGALNARGDGDDCSMSETASMRSLGSQKQTESKSRRRNKYLEDDTSDVFSVGGDLKHSFENSSIMFDHSLLSPEFVFKVTDAQGHTHRIKCASDSVANLKAAVADKMSATPETIVVTFIDDDKDEVCITTDSSLRDAVEWATKAGLTTLKLSAKVIKEGASSTRNGQATSSHNNASKSSASGSDASKDETFLTKVKSGKPEALYVVGAAAAGLALLGFVFMRGKK